MSNYDEQQARATSFPPPSAPPGGTGTAVQERPAPTPVAAPAPVEQPLAAATAPGSAPQAHPQAPGASAPAAFGDEPLNQTQIEALAQVALLSNQLGQGEGPSKAVSGTMMALSAMVGSLVILAIVLSVAA